MSEHTLRFAVTGKDWGDVENQAVEIAAGYFGYIRPRADREDRGRLRDSLKLTARPVKNDGLIQSWTAEVEVTA